MAAFPPTFLSRKQISFCIGSHLSLRLWPVCHKYSIQATLCSKKTFYQPVTVVRFFSPSFFLLRELARQMWFRHCFAKTPGSSLNSSARVFFFPPVGGFACWIHSGINGWRSSSFSQFVDKMYERHKRRYSLCDISKVDRAVDVVLLKVYWRLAFCLVCLFVAVVP